ncbi:MAG: V-type ATP synthase subunit I [Firmicutes bacterium]|nr:V-type ATP synthase subunit I [Bacillota bacterium]
MALVEMKRLTLLAMRADKDRVLAILQKAGCVQITEIDGEEASRYLCEGRGGLERAEERLQRIRWAIGELAGFAPKKGMLASMSFPVVSAVETARVQRSKSELMAVVGALESLERRRGELQGRQTRLTAELQQLSPWAGLDIPVERLRDTRETVQFAGTVSPKALEGVEAALSGLPVLTRIVGEAQDSACLWIVAHKSARDAVQGALKAAEFSARAFQGEGTPAEQCRRLEAERERVTAEREGLAKELAGLAGAEPDLKILCELNACEKEREAAGMRFAETSSAFLCMGWIPQSACEKLEKRLRASVPAMEIEFRAAADDEKPPTLMRNNRFIAPFEAVITNYSLPDARSLDPTFIMAPFFFCFFGMMVSDAGYGLIMAALIPLVIHFAKPKTGLRKIMWVLAFGGVSTVFWGAMFDTWFGASIRPILINPLEQPLEMMTLCMGLGCVHLLTGLGVAAYKNFKAGKPLDAFMDQFLWLFLLFGIALMILVPGLSTVGAVLAIAGAAGIWLTAGRAKPTLMGKFTGGFGALYGITSWLSDILSYMRLFGMGLATGVIGMVFNTLAFILLPGGILGAVAGVAVLVVGHVFNAVINVLGAYVHACRLQYIEFFGKFYEDGGDPFVPLSVSPRYAAVSLPGEDGVDG